MDAFELVYSQCTYAIEPGDLGQNRIGANSQTRARHFVEVANCP